MSQQSTSAEYNCPLCQEVGGELVFEATRWRVVWANEPLYPGFLRVIWAEHVREFSDLTESEQLECVRVVSLCERFLLEEVQPSKINLATLGNVVPHLHWHIIPRFENDTHFPAPVWAKATKTEALCEEQKALFNRKDSLVNKLGSQLQAYSQAV